MGSFGSSCKLSYKSQFLVSSIKKMMVDISKKFGCNLGGSNLGINFR